MPTQQERFWEADSFAIVTDNTKPAIKWAIQELTKRGKKVYTIDISGKSEEAGNVKHIFDLPDNVDHAVIGVTTTQPAEIMDDLREKGVKNIWVHFMTETPEVKDRCRESTIQCITGRCPMMYLGGGVSIHGLHRAVAKIIGKY